MTANITNRAGACNVEGISGGIKLIGNAQINESTKKVQTLNVTTFVNKPTPELPENFICAGSANFGNGCNVNMAPGYEDSQLPATVAIFDLIADIERQYAE